VAPGPTLHFIRILQGFFYPKRLNRRNKGVMLTKISQSRTSSYSLADVIHRMIPLNGGPDLSWRCMWYFFLFVLFVHVLPLDSCLHLEVHVPYLHLEVSFPYLDLGVALLLRKVDLVLVAPVVAHHLLP
jgi:hypothetical protein